MSGIISARAWGKVWAYRSTFLLGLLNTVETAFFAILLSLALGVIFGLMATSGKRVLQIISRVYVEIMQNTPILLQLCFFYYALAFSGHSIGILPTGIVALGVYTGAYMAEVVRAGIEAVPKGQFESPPRYPHRHDVWYPVPCSVPGYPTAADNRWQRLPGSPVRSQHRHAAGCCARKY